MGRTTIEWTEASWNPITGCSPISEGCDNCYARRLAEGRLRDRYLAQPAVQRSEAGDPFAVRLWPDRLLTPTHWTKPRMIFVCSMSDLFHAAVPFEFQLQIVHIMLRTPWHTYQVLTKRPADAARTLNRAMIELGSGDRETLRENIWIGTSIECQKYDYRLRHLLNVDAHVRFLSCEPLLGPIDFLEHELGAIDWLILGGESGPGARSMQLEWARGIRDQCRALEIPLFVKQLGSAWAAETGGKDGKGATMAEWPEDLRIREWPERKSYLERLNESVAVRGRAGGALLPSTE